MDALLSSTASAWALPMAAGLFLALVGSRVMRRLRRRGPAAPGTPVPHGDPLTGLPTRTDFEAALEEASDAADRAGTSLVVMYLGLDDFRLVNEGYGHDVGDRLLSAVAQRLSKAVPGLVMAARNAGDEFMLLLQANGTQAHAAAQQLRQALKEPFALQGHMLSVDASIGLTLYPDQGAHQRLVTQALAAMRAVKEAGGGGHAQFEPAMGVDMRQRAELLRDLRQALARGALQLVYQPKVDARSLQVTAAEALLRWHDGQRGVVSPAVFVPVAEKHGLMGDIGRWVIEEAARHAGLWRDQGLRMRVAVNVSGHQLRQEGWVEHLCACLERHRIPPSRFTVEITETVAMEDTGVTRQAFERLREAGVHVSIDDFGTGQSSLAALRKLPAAELKIDRAFVADLETSAEARSIAGTILAMARQLDLRVVAEGVETAPQRDWLVSAGCDELQGYLFARPMSPEALAIWADGAQGPSAVGFRDSLFKETMPSTAP